MTTPYPNSSSQTVFTKSECIYNETDIESLLAEQRSKYENHIFEKESEIRSLLTDLENDNESLKKES